MSIGKKFISKGSDVIPFCLFSFRFFPVFSSTHQLCTYVHFSSVWLYRFKLIFSPHNFLSRVNIFPSFVLPTLFDFAAFVLLNFILIIRNISWVIISMISSSMILENLTSNSDTSHLFIGKIIQVTRAWDEFSIKFWSRTYSSNFSLFFKTMMTIHHSFSKAIKGMIFLDIG